MFDFSMLSLNDIPFQDTGFNYILESKTIEDLLFNIYSFENPNISFEELKEKLIDYYIQDANEEFILSHLTFIKNNIYYDNDNNLNNIVNYISSPYGTEYLKSIYIKFKY
jgi:hypothetical protein